MQGSYRQPLDLASAPVSLNLLCALVGVAAHSELLPHPSDYTLGSGAGIEMKPFWSEL